MELLAPLKPSESYRFGWSFDRMQALPTSQLLGFVEPALHVARRAVPHYTSKVSKRRYTLHQHIVLLYPKVRKNTTYQMLLDELIEMPRIRSALELEELPSPQPYVKRSTGLIWLCGAFFSTSPLHSSRLTVSSGSTPPGSIAITPRNTTQSERS